MHMKEAIEGFASQLAYSPVIENNEALVRKERLLVCGMGGSQYFVNILNAWNESLLAWQHRDYGLPQMPERALQEHLVVACSFSGNTEETVSSLEEAIDRKLAVAVITAGGKLLEIAKTHKLPYIQIPVPAEHFQPRAATGLLIKALLAIQGDALRTEEMARLSSTLQPASYEAAGKAIAAQCQGKVPLIYASRRNLGLAMAWKIKFNETGKIPAFFNGIPELNHNEMTSFDVQDASRALSERFMWIFLTDEEDHPRILKRFDVLEELLHARGLPVLRAPLDGATRLERIFASTLTADWSALHVAAMYGLESNEVPMVEEFKKLIAS